MSSHAAARIAGVIGLGIAAGITVFPTRPRAAELLASLPADGPRLASAVELFRSAGKTAEAERSEARLLSEAPESSEARRLAGGLGPSGVAERLGSSEARVHRIHALLDTH